MIQFPGSSAAWDKYANNIFLQHIWILEFPNSLIRCLVRPTLLQIHKNNNKICRNVSKHIDC